MTSYFIIFVSLVAGIVCKNVKHFPRDSAQTLNAFIIYVSLPALVLLQFPKLLQTTSWRPDFIWLVATPWVGYLLGALIFVVWGKSRHWGRPQSGALILTAGLGNTAFLGYPLVESLVGGAAVSVAIVFDQFGTFLILSTLGLLTAAVCSGTRATPGQMLHRVFSFPPFVALGLSILWFVVGLPFAQMAQPILERLALTLVPLALFAVGLQLRPSVSLLRRYAEPLALGLLYKLILFPILVHFVFVDQLDVMFTKVAVLQSGMAPMITAAVVAAEYDLDADLANLMVGFGIPLSLLTVPLLNWI